MKKPKLCYSDKNFAFFCYKLIGDDWNDSPAVCNAGEPYEPIEIIAYRGICSSYDSELYSVDEINSGKNGADWFEDDNRNKWGRGMTPEQFCKKVWSLGGEIFKIVKSK